MEFEDGGKHMSGQKLRMWKELGCVCLALGDVIVDMQLSGTFSWKLFLKQKNIYVHGCRNNEKGEIVIYRSI